jgi:hypothetical protein
LNGIWTFFLHTICLWKRSSCWERLRRNSKQRNWWYLSSDAYSGQLNDQMKNVSRIDSAIKYRSTGPGRSWLATSLVSNVTACWKWDITQFISSWSTKDFWNICKICFQCCRRTYIIEKYPFNIGISINLWSLLSTSSVTLMTGIDNICI